jgi:hypothetical protein
MGLGGGGALPRTVKIVSLSVILPALAMVPVAIGAV